jgi:hypothetical protein
MHSTRRRGRDVIDWGLDWSTDSHFGFYTFAAAAAIRQREMRAGDSGKVNGCGAEGCHAGAT